MGKAVLLMKSILIGDPAMCKHAFPASVRAQLGAWTQLPDAPVTKEEILAQPDLYRDTELIFSTWDMPHFTREEIQVCFPALRAVFYAAGSVQHFAREFLSAGVHVGRQTPFLLQSMPQRRSCLQTRDFIMPCAPVGRLKDATGRWNGSGRCPAVLIRRSVFLALAWLAGR